MQRVYCARYIATLTHATLRRFVVRIPLRQPFVQTITHLTLTTIYLGRNLVEFRQANLTSPTDFVRNLQDNCNIDFLEAAFPEFHSAFHALVTHRCFM
jgi:hypothetical protein